MRLWTELRSHLQYKIILPFLMLTLLVALAGSAVAFLFITGTAQERLNNQLAQVARTAGDSIVGLENANLLFLREVAFAGQNTATGAPAVADALEGADAAGLEQAIQPYFDISLRRQSIRVDRMMIFNTRGQTLLDWEHPRTSGTEKVVHSPSDLSQVWFVGRILQGSQDPLGDKYAGLLAPAEGDTNYLFTAAPVITEDGAIVGGIVVATRLDSLLQELSATTSSAFITLYTGSDGKAFASTIVPVDGLQSLDMRPDLVGAVRDLAVAEQQGIFDTTTVNQRQYQQAFVPLKVRNVVVGLLAVALAADYVTGPWGDARAPLTVLTITLMLAIIGLGVFVARQITRPLQDLVDTAQAVTSGDLQRRSTVTVRDEVGLLAGSFNEMTQHLTDLYSAVRAEASQRAAIVESITDSVMVCDPDGKVLVVNRALRLLLRLKDDEPAPKTFAELPLTPVSDQTLSFGDARTPDLFEIDGQIVRLRVAPVIVDDQTRLGDVYVLQDLTDEVEIDRAKTNFIATISHELRTPLTVLGGSSELMLRELVGPLTGEQRELLESMRKHTLSMTTLLNNVITLAGLESGTLTIEVEPVGLRRVIDDLLWSVRPAITAKGLQLVVDVPNDLPDILADAHQLRNVLGQLLDNARRFTAAGSVTICARHRDGLVRVDVSDTGCGIGPDLAKQLFTRFSRGMEGLNSSERGIGLGLAIARMLIERQGGQIWLDHTSEQGSTFSFTLPSIDANPQHNNAAFAPAA
ncbi:MAG TPA: ATP-binding protein [Roseiflexaceae bacterium]|nr:ATP-binding protein [Roseiflexaceae bacterium]